MSTALVKTAMFFALSLAPLLGLSVGVVDPYGSEHPEFPRWDDVLHGESGSLDRLGEAILHRSAVTRAAIVFKSWLSYEVLHFVDTDGSLLSGRDGWLFHKNELQRDCHEAAELERGLVGLDLTTDIAAAAGVELVISLPPDKSVVYPDKLHPLTRNEWLCKKQNSEMLHRAVAARAPRVVDHRALLSAARAAEPERKLYFLTDSHWTSLGAARAFRQLLTAIIPGLAAGSLPPPRLPGKKALYEGDLRQILLLPRGEEYDVVDQKVERSLGRFSRDRPGVKTFLLRDSFYRHLFPIVRAAFPGTPVAHIDDEDAHGGAVEISDRLIVNSVERLFFTRVTRGSLARGHTLSETLLRRNMRFAEGCSGFHSAAGAPLYAGDVIGAGSGWRASGPDPRITFSVPQRSADRLTCLQITAAGPPDAELEVFFPSKGQAVTFEAGRSIRVPVTSGRQVVTLVLPEYMKGNAVRIDLGIHASAQLELLAVEFGEIEGPLSLMVPPKP